jgi:hypothetical protein
MTADVPQNRKLTWNRAGGLTLAVLLVSGLVGVWMMGQRVFLAPPLAASTVYLYIAVGALPALIAFLLIAVRARPAGSRVMLVALPVFAGVIFVIYLALIGPGFYTDIQCQAAPGPGSAGRLDCGCLFEATSGKALVKCSAEELAPLPLIRLVEEKWGGDAKEIY